MRILQMISNSVVTRSCHDIPKNYSLSNNHSLTHDENYSPLLYMYHKCFFFLSQTSSVYPVQYVMISKLN